MYPLGDSEKLSPSTQCVPPGLHCCKGCVYGDGLSYINLGGGLRGPDVWLDTRLGERVKVFFRCDHCL